MTQWFLEKALLGSPEQGLRLGAWGEGWGGGTSGTRTCSEIRWNVGEGGSSVVVF